MARIETPEQVQRAVCRVLAGKIAGQWQVRLTEEQIWQSRQCAERELREASLAQGLDYECRFSELAPYWMQNLIGEYLDAEPISYASLLDFILCTEIELEQHALYVKAGVTAFLQWLNQQHIRVYAISDMYLDGEYIRALLSEKKTTGLF